MASLKDVSDLAGVSPTTASLVLNGRAAELRISRRSIEAVEEAARRIGYQGNYHARMLASRSTATIGLAYDMERLPTRWSGAFQKGIAEAGRRRGFSILQIPLSGDRPVAEQAAEVLVQKRVDGMIFLQATPEERLKDPEGQPYPTVSILGTGAHCGVDVRLDERPGLRAAVADLRAKGHRRIATLASQERPVPKPRERLPRFIKFSREAGMEVESMEIPGPTELIHSGGALINCLHRQLVVARLAIPAGVTAVFAANDYHAVALGFYLRDLGRRIPEDLSLIGFDDTVSDAFVPPLNTVTFSREQLGAMAFEEILALIDAGPRPGGRSRTVRLPARYLERESVALPGSGGWKG